MLGHISRLAAGRRSRWVVIGAWLALAVAMIPFQAKLQERAADESETFMARGSDSLAAEQLRRRGLLVDGIVERVLVVAKAAARVAPIAEPDVAALR